MAISWDDVRIVLALQRTRSMAAAARKLGVNQSTVSRRIAAIESAMQTGLFFHGADGYELTRAGEALLPRMVRMEGEALALEREAEGADSNLSGWITLTGPDAFAAYMLAPILARFQQRYPHIQIELSCDERTLDLRRREADVALRIGRPQESSLVARKVAPLSFAAYVSRSYLEAKGRPRRDLSGHSFVAVKRSVSEAWQKKNAREARVVLTTNSTVAHLQAVAQGMGIGILPCYLAREASLVCVAKPDAALTRSLWLVVHKDMRRAARIRALTDMLAAELAQMSAQLTKP